jgi:hypothetical protein
VLAAKAGPKPPDSPRLPSKNPETNKLLQTLIGKNVSGVPAFLPVTVEACDATGQKAQLSYLAVLDVPLDMLSEKPAAPMAATAPGSAATPTGEPAADAERVQKLEKRVSDLESKMELLIRLMQNPSTKTEK